MIVPLQRPSGRTPLHLDAPEARGRRTAIAAGLESETLPKARRCGGQTIERRLRCRKRGSQLYVTCISCNAN